MKCKKFLISLVMLLFIPYILSIQTISVIGSKFMREKSPHEHSNHGASMKKGGSPLTAGADHHTKTSNGIHPPEAGKNSIKEVHKEKSNEHSNSNNGENSKEVIKVSEGPKFGSQLTSGHTKEEKSLIDGSKKSNAFSASNIASLASGSAASQIANSNSSRKTEYGAFKDYFSQTSKNNENIAWKALSCFIGGILMFFGSIYLTCWNERQSVRESQIIDIIADTKSCQVLNLGDNINDLSTNKIYIASGNLTITEEAKINDLSIDFPYTHKNVLMIKYDVESYDEYTITGDPENSTQEQVNSKWNSVSEYSTNVSHKLKSNFYCGSGKINGEFQIDISKLRNLIEYSKDSHNYIFQMEDKDKILAYLKEELGSQFTLHFDRDIVYLVQSLSTSTGLNPSTHIFQKGDKRIRIRYVSLI